MARIVGLWRFPVKGMAGTRLDRADLDELGIVGDRGHVVIDAGTGAFLSLRNTPRMALLRPLWSPSGVRIGECEIPSDRPGPARICELWGRPVAGIDCGDEAADRLSEFLARPVRLLRLDRERAHYTGFADAHPLLLLSMASVRDLERRVGEPVDVRRFRANVLVDGCEAFAEDGWAKVAYGKINLIYVKPCSRCVAVTVDPDTAAVGREPLRTLGAYRLAPGGAILLGVNLRHDRPGTLEVGGELVPA